MDAKAGGYTASGREKALERNLEDANLQIQYKDHQLATDQDDIMTLREKMKKLEMDHRANRRELMNAEETNNRLKDQLKESMHKINLHQIENEALIKQIDIADAKTREKDDELRI